MGAVISSDNFQPYYAFKGIPYAEPPVNDLRFRGPIPHRGWENIRNATEHGNTCPQMNFRGQYEGVEDCLFLNVYSRELSEKRPVMVWIHAGGFLFGSGNSDLYGPEYLLNDGVILVTFNYRLAALGFLTTNDESAPGNYGMKDMVEVLRWIQRNIAAFGGDPDNVTIFGLSAGGAAVHYLMLSRMANGLFHNAISQSGSTLNPWALGTPSTSNRWNMVLINNIGIDNTSTSSEMLIELRSRTAEEIIRESPTLVEIDIPFRWHELLYMPNVDPINSLEPIFLHDIPRRIIQSGDYNDVNYMIGYTDAESLEAMFDQLLNPETYPTLDANPALLIPRFWNVPVPSVAASTIVDLFMEKYFDGNPISESTAYNYSILATDHQFILPSHEVATLHAQTSNKSVYQFVFSFVGDLNAQKISTGLMDYPGAIHGDELMYLFNPEGGPDIEDTNPAAVTRRRMVRMWTNFAKYGNPTEFTDSDVTISWQQVNNNNAYLEIGDDLIPSFSPTYERASFWDDLRERYANVTV